MGSKLQDNGLFESSRMILPEHREAFIAREEEKMIREKPSLDDQELQMIGMALTESYKNKQPVTITLFDPLEDQQLEGFVTNINMQNRKIKFMVYEDDWEWIDINQIISASA